MENELNMQLQKYNVKVINYSSNAMGFYFGGNNHWMQIGFQLNATQMYLDMLAACIFYESYDIISIWWNDYEC